jgi:hypothetical protein
MSASVARLIARSSQWPDRVGMIVGKLDVPKVIEDWDYPGKRTVRVESRHESSGSRCRTGVGWWL